MIPNLLCFSDTFKKNIYDIMCDIKSANTPYVFKLYKIKIKFNFSHEYDMCFISSKQRVLSFHGKNSSGLKDLSIRRSKSFCQKTKLEVLFVIIGFICSINHGSFGVFIEHVISIN